MSFFLAFSSPRCSRVLSNHLFGLANPTNQRLLSTSPAAFNHGLAAASHEEDGIRGSRNSEALKKAVKSKVKAIDEAHPYVSPLTDGFNRHHTYLRISLTEKCNLRCTYCMPEEGVPLQPSVNMLADDEILKLARLFVEQGVTKIRLTGGEPTVRKGITKLIASLNQLQDIGLTQIGITSNGIALHRKLPTLVSSGLTHLNISLDTLHPAKFEFITRRPGHHLVMASLETALGLADKGLTVKLNVVIMKGFNEDEILDFIEITKNRKVEIRFIEYMPFSGNRWSYGKLYSYQDMLSVIRSKYKKLIKKQDDANDTSKGWKVPGFQGSFGFITSMTEHFCGTCNRLRITADGNLKVCLFGQTEVSLRDKLRSNASDAELVETIAMAVGRKKEKHAGMKQLKDGMNRPMILIGGTSPIPSASQRSPLTSRKPPREGSSKYTSTASTLTHIDPETGKPRMVSITPKVATLRSATASGKIYLPEAAFSLLSNSQPSSSLNKKGDPLIVAQLAGIMGAKRTSDLIPLCHQINLSSVDVKFELIQKTGTNNGGWVRVDSVAECVGGTGVEMEALTSVSVTLLTIWDMVKAVAGKEMIIQDVCVTKKSGGKSGDWTRRLD
ncbi:molybdenum cofactor biosynthesis prote [Phaffia rhodozyma]|uniref:Molybdenum cofactor biosynthesis prote n=1 Tax=Phaffia rhodozyma TaxID=264483 RepID=A0A0F7SMA0_PHARH|nr:molybdenum cofactor biosynthesis prote [Phaffia rhodozyma]